VSFILCFQLILGFEIETFLAHCLSTNFSQIVQVKLMNDRVGSERFCRINDAESTAVTSLSIAQSRPAVDARPSSMIGGRCVFSFGYSDFGFDVLGFYAFLRLCITVVWKGCRSGARSFF
jgi:hypothetical protein